MQAIENSMKGSLKQRLSIYSKTLFRYSGNIDTIAGQGAIVWSTFRLFHAVSLHKDTPPYRSHPYLMADLAIAICVRGCLGQPLRDV